MPRASYDYSSIAVDDSGAETSGSYRSSTNIHLKTAAATTTTVSPPAPPKPNTFNLEMKVPLNEKEAHQISRLYRALSRLAFWKKTTNNNNKGTSKRRRSGFGSGSKKSSSNNHVFEEAKFVSPFYRHAAPPHHHHHSLNRQRSADMLHNNRTFDTCSTSLSTLASYDSPSKQTMEDSFFAAVVGPTTTTTSSNNSSSTVIVSEPIVSSTEWWEGSDDHVLLLSTADDECDDNYEAIWFPRSDDDYYADEAIVLPSCSIAEELIPDDGASLVDDVVTAEALMEELEVFSEAMSLVSNPGVVRVEDAISLATFQEDLSVWFRVRERVKQAVQGMFLRRRRSSMGGGGKAKKNNSPKRAATRHETSTETRDAPEEDNDDKNHGPVCVDCDVDEEDEEDMSDTASLLYTPTRKATRNSAVTPGSPSTSSKSSRCSTRGSECGDDTKSLPSSTILKLNCSVDDQGEVEAYELEWPLFAEQQQQVDPSHLLHEDDELPHVLSQEETDSLAEFVGDLSTIAAGDASSLASSPLNPHNGSAVMSVAMDPKDHCAQLVVLHRAASKMKRPQRNSTHSSSDASVSQDASLLSSVLLNAASLASKRETTVVAPSEPEPEPEPVLVEPEEDEEDDDAVTPEGVEYPRYIEPQVQYPSRPPLLNLNPHHDSNNEQQQPPDNETPVARARRLAAEHRESEMMETRTTTTITTRDTLLEMQQQQQHQEAVPFDEPEETFLPGTPQRRLAMLQQQQQQQEQEKGFLDLVHERLFQPILKFTQEEAMCGVPPESTNVPSYGMQRRSHSDVVTTRPLRYSERDTVPRQRQQQQRVAGQHEQRETMESRTSLPQHAQEEEERTDVRTPDTCGGDEYSDVDYSAAVAESAAYDNLNNNGGDANNHNKPYFCRPYGDESTAASSSCYRASHRKSHSPSSSRRRSRRVNSFSSF